MAESSYIKVYERLASCADGRALAAKIAERIASLRVADVEFVLARPDKLGEPARAVPRFVVASSLGPHCKVENSSFWLEVDAFAARAEVKAVIDANFGVKGRVPTYFCRKDVVLGDDSRRGTLSFYSWWTRKLGENHDASIEAAKARVGAQIREMAASEEVQAKGRAFLVEQAVRDIKLALSAYDHLGKEVLKEAIDEYLIHSITES
jgi:hypothetical protein